MQPNTLFYILVSIISISFIIDKILDSTVGFNIAQTIISLGKSLNLEVVAEGVETTEQYDLLKKMNIDAMQGYLIARPMDKEGYAKWHSANTNAQ